MLGTRQPTLEPAEVLSSVCTIQLSFCLRYGLKTDFDIEKFIVAKANLQYEKNSRLDKMFGSALWEVERNFNAMEDAVPRLHHSLYDYTFLSCARIVAAKGYEEDAERLQRLAKLLGFTDDHAQMLIALAKAEMSFIKLGASY